MLFLRQKSPGPAYSNKSSVTNDLQVSLTVPKTLVLQILSNPSALIFTSHDHNPDLAKTLVSL